MWLKCVLIPLGLTAATSAADVRIHKKILGSGNTTLIISNNEIEDIIKIVKSFNDSGVLLTGAAWKVQNEVKEQKGEFLIMLLGTLGASLFGNILVGKRIYWARKSEGINREGEEIVRARYGNNEMDF